MGATRGKSTPHSAIVGWQMKSLSCPSGFGCVHFQLAETTRIFMFWFSILPQALGESNLSQDLSI